MTQRHIYGPAAGADDPLVSYAGSSTLIGNARMLYADERGSIVYSTDSSGGGAAINSYDAFGIPGTGNAGRFQYTGQIWIADLGAYHYKARIYSPTLGRFLQTDPIGYADGMNMYRYVGNDPVNSVDPSGLARDDILVTAWKTILREGVAPENFRDFKAIPYDDHNVIGEDIVVNARKPRKRKSSRFIPAAAPQSGQCAAPSSGRSDIPRGAGAKSFSEAESIARRIANEELARTRRITDNYRLGGHNDIYDAERHARWVYRMSVAIGSGWAGLFATGHEGEGMRDGQPFIEMQMDLSNNSLGMNAAINGAGIPTRSTPGLTYIRNGKLVRKGC